MIHGQTHPSTRASLCWDKREKEKDKAKAKAKKEAKKESKKEAKKEAEKEKEKPPPPPLEKGRREGKGRVRERDIGAERVKWGGRRKDTRNVRANGCE